MGSFSQVVVFEGSGGVLGFDVCLWGGGGGGFFCGGGGGVFGGLGGGGGCYLGWGGVKNPDRNTNRTLSSRIGKGDITR